MAKVHSLGLPELYTKVTGKKTNVAGTENTPGATATAMRENGKTTSPTEKEY